MNDILKKHTVVGKAVIIKENDKVFVSKEKKEKTNLKGLYTYLKSRDFHYYPEIIDSSRSDVNLYKYYEDIEIPIPQKGEDLIKILANLHHKTTYFKEVSEDKFKEIYENIESNILYLSNYYDNMYNKIFRIKYPSPSEYLFIRNYYKIGRALNFAQKELTDWYDLVKKEKKQRVSVVHNNLKLDHYLKSDEAVIISWDNHIIDSPVLDLVKLYQNEYLKLNFKDLLDIYEYSYKLLNHEKKLLFILICLPQKIIFTDDQLDNCKNIRKKLDYIFKTEDLIKPYYSNDEKE